MKADCQTAYPLDNKVESRTLCCKMFALLVACALHVRTALARKVVEQAKRLQRALVLRRVTVVVCQNFGMGWTCLHAVLQRSTRLLASELCVADKPCAKRRTTTAAC